MKTASNVKKQGVENRAFENNHLLTTQLHQTATTPTKFPKQSQKIRQPRSYPAQNSGLHSKFDFHSMSLICYPVHLSLFSNIQLLCLKFRVEVFKDQGEEYFQSCAFEIGCFLS